MEKTQREFLLRQQMEAIKKQLNEGGSDVVSTYRERVAKAEMPEGVLAEVTRELDRLERTSEQNPEYGWIRTYLDWMLDIPWNVRSEDNYDLVEARRILDEDHTGLSDVKDRIIEFLAVRKLRKERGLGCWADADRARSSPWSDLPAWARPRWASRVATRWAASSRASRWAASVARLTSAATAATYVSALPGRIGTRFKRPAPRTR